jgi:hypothetical protein
MEKLNKSQKKFLAESGAIQIFTGTEFEEALNLAKAEIMAVAIETTKNAILLERQACSDLVDALADKQDSDDLRKIIKSIAVKIRDRKLSK